MCYDRRMMNHNPIDAAEGVLRARAAELEAAREALSRAETATHTAAENVTRARALSDAAAADLEAATLAAETAEKAWTADQTPSLWTKLSNARGVRDQAELRARSLHVGAETAAADHAAALARVASARADTTYPVNRGRLRALSSWERTEGGHWVCECDGVRFRFTRVGRGWSGKAYYDGDECMTTCTDRDKGLVELYAMVRHNRAEAEARRRFPGN